MQRITPLIICGGVGTRLWPISRTQSPKQFQKVGDDASMTFFQSAVERHRGPGYAQPCIVSAIRHRDTICAQLAEIRCKADIIHEPMGRNTGPAVLAAAMRLYAKDPQALMVVVPADHVIEGDLNSTILSMAAAARAGRIITFGIKPRYAETGFGYITDAGPIVEYPGLHQVERFVEKPPTRKARLLVESDIAYWASGLSMFAARTIIEEYQKFDPATALAVRNAVEKGQEAADGFELDAHEFARATSAPTESTVFEKTDRIALAPLDVQWSDVGSWTAMYGISQSNPQGNVLQGDVIAVETTNSMVRSSSRLVTLVGVKDVIVIDTPDALLVTRVGHCQSVKKVAEFLKNGNRIEVERHQAPRPVAPLHAEPTGTMTTLYHSPGFEMAVVLVDAGSTLTLDPMSNRELAMARGALIVSTAQGTSALSMGQRIDLDGDAPTLLINASDEAAEVILMTARPKGAGEEQRAPARSGPDVPTAKVLYA